MFWKNRKKAERCICEKEAEIEKWKEAWAKAVRERDEALDKARFNGMQANSVKRELAEYKAFVRKCLYELSERITDPESCGACCGHCGEES